MTKGDFDLKDTISIDIKVVWFLQNSFTITLVSYQTQTLGLLRVWHVYLNNLKIKYWLGMTIWFDQIHNFAVIGQSNRLSICFAFINKRY